jgi:hypothetical protein
MQNSTRLSSREREILTPSWHAARNIFKRNPLRGLLLLDALSRLERRWQRRARRRAKQR